MVDSRPGERTADVLANAAGGGEQRLGAGAANESAKAVDPVGRSARSETAQPAPLGSFLRHLRLPRGTHHPKATPWESVNTQNLRTLDKVTQNIRIWRQCNGYIQDTQLGVRVLAL